jgi:hypothetical protein
MRAPHATGGLYLEGVKRYWGVVQRLGLQILALTISVRIRAPHLNPGHSAGQFFENLTGSSPHFTYVQLA